MKDLDSELRPPLVVNWAWLSWKHGMVVHPGSAVKGFVVTEGPVSKELQASHFQVTVAIRETTLVTYPRGDQDSLRQRPRAKLLQHQSEQRIVWQQTVQANEGDGSFEISLPETTPLSFHHVVDTGDTDVLMPSSAKIECKATACCKTTHDGVVAATPSVTLDVRRQTTTTAIAKMSENEAEENTAVVSFTLKSPPSEWTQVGFCGLWNETKSYFTLSPEPASLVVEAGKTIIVNLKHLLPFAGNEDSANLAHPPFPSFRLQILETIQWNAQHHQYKRTQVLQQVCASSDGTEATITIPSTARPSLRGHLTGVQHKLCCVLDTSEGREQLGGGTLDLILE